MFFSCRSKCFTVMRWRQMATCLWSRRSWCQSGMHRQVWGLGLAISFLQGSECIERKLLCQAIKLCLTQHRHRRWWKFTNRHTREFSSPSQLIFEQNTNKTESNNLIAKRWMQRKLRTWMTMHPTARTRQGQLGHDSSWWPTFRECVYWSAFKSWCPVVAGKLENATFCSCTQRQGQNLIQQKHNSILVSHLDRKIGLQMLQTTNWGRGRDLAGHRSDWCTGNQTLMLFPSGWLKAIDSHPIDVNFLPKEIQCWNFNLHKTFPFFWFYLKVEKSCNATLVTTGRNSHGKNCRGKTLQSNECRALFACWKLAALLVCLYHLSACDKILTKLKALCCMRTYACIRKWWHKMNTRFHPGENVSNYAGSKPKTVSFQKILFHSRKHWCSQVSSTARPVLKRNTVLGHHGAGVYNESTT